MIFDHLKNIHLYSRNDFAALNQAFDLIKSTDFYQLEKGIFQITPQIKIVKKPFVFLFDEEKYWGEMHEKSLDIHLFNGIDEEILYFKPDYSYAQSDILEVVNNADTTYVRTNEYNNSVNLKKDHFAIFFPNELHYCAVKDSKYYKDENFLKIVVKVFFN